MHKLLGINALLLSFVLMFAVGISLASPVSGSKGSPAKTSSKTTKKVGLTTSKPAAKSTTTSSAKRSPVKKTSHVLASAEDLSGTITAVDPSRKEVTLVGSNGMPYDFNLTQRTQVELSKKNMGIKALASESHKQATVHFLPSSGGNLAESIHVSAS